MSRAEQLIDQMLGENADDMAKDTSTKKLRDIALGKEKSASPRREDMMNAEQLIDNTLEAKEPDKAKLNKWADQLEKKAAKYDELAAKSDRPADKSTHKNDAKDLRKIAVAVKANNHKKAVRLSDKMDTAVRDEIATAAFNWMNQGRE